MSEENGAAPQNGEDHGDEIVTLVDYVEDQQQSMEDANAVLGAIDDKKCTYSEGYMKRQALYSCLTCIPEARTNCSKAAGVCLGCSFHCHEGHELVELYTKRNFRCDCGNGKFSNEPCKLENTKSDVNEFNEYNQNFCGKYCTCNRPYPDLKDSVDDDMIQCVICEDWFHSRHLGIELPPNSTFAEMSCETCIKEHPFLLHYISLCIKTSDHNGEVCEEAQEDTKTEDKENESPVNTDRGDHCTKPKDKSEVLSSKFWSDVDWRKQLCTCPECIRVYEEEKVMFLLDPQDPVIVYEEKGKEKGREFAVMQQADGMKYLNSLNRVPLMEALAGYNDLKENLVEYLKKFAENKKVVREEDIREFFSNFDSRKKQKCQVSHYCG